LIYATVYYYYRIYTDGSKSDDRVGAAVVHRNKTKCVPLPNTAIIFRAELYALLLAIEVVSLQAISGFKIELELVQRL